MEETERDDINKEGRIDRVEAGIRKGMLGGG